MGSRGFSQIFEVQRKPDQVAHPNDQDAKHSCIHVNCAAFKLECLSLKHKLSHFAMCRKLLINATQSAYAELQRRRSGAVAPA